MSESQVMTKTPVQNTVRPQRLDWFALLGLAVAITSALTAALAGFGHKLNWWHFSVGFTVLGGAALGALLSMVLSLAGVFRTWAATGRKGFRQALLGLAISVVVVAIPLYWLWLARSVPPIHDITTDTKNPPVFSTLLPLRAEAPNPSRYGGPRIATQQQEAYPDIKPLHLPLSPERVLDEAVAVAQSLGWKVIGVRANEDGARFIEATDTTFWFGFVDDIVIRITSFKGGSKVDVRSVSRVGRSDVGANARRIGAFLGALKEVMV